MNLDAEVALSIDELLGTSSTTCPDSNLPHILPIPIAILSNLSCPQDQEFHESLSNLHEFKHYLQNFYRLSFLPESTTEEAMNQIEYIYDLFTAVYHRGGWSNLNGTSNWSVVSKNFGNMNPQSLREDYETYLFAFEKSLSPSTKYDSNTLDTYLSEMSPSHMKTFEVFRPTLLDNELSSSSFPRFLTTEAISFPEMLSKGMKVNLDLFSKEALKQSSLLLQYNDVNFSISELEQNASYYTETPLNTYINGYSDISNHIPGAFHWNSECSLLRYTNEIPGISTPTLVLLKESLTCMGGPSYNSLVGVYLTTQGRSEWWGIHQDLVPALSKKVQKHLNSDIFDGKWRPDERYLLANGFDFYYCIQEAGDIMLACTDIVYWVYSHETILVYWYLLPFTRVPAVCSAYLATLEARHQFNLPLLAIEYLNTELWKIDDNTATALKSIITGAIGDENSAGNYSMETFDYKSCSVCGKDLVWRYAKCGLCLIQSEVNALCLKCAAVHSCREIQYLEKFTAVDLYLLFQRIDKRMDPESREVQSVFTRVITRLGEKGCGESLWFEAGGFGNRDNFKEFKENGASRDKQLRNAAKNEGKFVSIDIDECYKRMGKKKQKIREAMQNPLHGPRFTYEIEEKKQRENFDTSVINIPMQVNQRKNPLAELVKRPRDTSLSALVSLSRKKELEERKNGPSAKKGEISH